jgi:uncharacterized protein YgbK (DUF1537 family)
MSYIFVADDFTGASDTLATLARGGMRARLFRDLPEPRELTGLDAWGIATHARSLGRAEMIRLAARIGEGLAHLAPDFLHLKICSTFDSGPDIGNVALLAHGLADALGIADIAVIGGQPSLGRHAIFGTLFARGPDRQIHRLDRHPVMAIHPVTPMHEADLIRHLANLGLNGIEHVGRGKAGRGFPRLYDAVDQADIDAAGQDLLASGKRLLVMGASSVAEAWLASQPSRPARSPEPVATAGPILTFVGSRSSLTTSQVAEVRDMPCLPINPAELVGDAASTEANVTWAQTHLSRGQNVIAFLTAETAGGVSAAELAERSADLVARIIDTVPIGGLVVAGGDTSSAIVNRLAPDWLDHAGAVCPGVPILRARLSGKLLPMILKGGQMGGDDFFARAIACLGREASASEL